MGPPRSPACPAPATTIPPTRPAHDGAGVSASRRLPPELVSHILSLTNDWELATTLGVRTDLALPGPWLEFATPLDWAILRSSTSVAPVRYAVEHSDASEFSQWGTRAMLRFAYVHVLEYLFDTVPDQVRQECRELLPVVASAWGRTTVLEWANQSDLGLAPDPKTTAEAIDEASRHGQVQGNSL